MRRILTSLFLLSVSGAVSAQSPQPTQKFDAVDISLRLKTGTTGQPNMTGGVLRGGRYDLRNGTMVDFIATAYSVMDNDLIVGGPSWLERNRFDIAAKAPQGTSQANLKLMLQSNRLRSSQDGPPTDRKSTRLNSSHLGISYAVFCLRK